MIRLIKRYGGSSRKLYDTEESRYVSLEELSGWIRAGQELKVVDRQSGEDVTAQTLAQSIYEEHRLGGTPLSREFLHQIIRRGNQALVNGVGQVQAKVNDFVCGSVGRLTQVGGTREDLALLRQRLKELELALAEMETGAGGRKAPGRSRPARRK
jgi:polyhydroxyalkanoate synthesis repressor PhaR